MRKMVILFLITIILVPTAGGDSHRNTDCLSCHSSSYPISGYVYYPPTVFLNVSMFTKRGVEFPVEVGIDFIDYDIKELLIEITQDPKIFSFNESTIEAYDLKKGTRFKFTATAIKNGVSKIIVTVNAITYYEHKTIDGYDYREEVIEKSRIISVGSTSLVPSSWNVLLDDAGGEITLTAVEDITDLTVFTSSSLEAKPTGRNFLSADSELDIFLRPTSRKKIDENIIISWRVNNTPYAIPISVLYNPQAPKVTDYFHCIGRITGISTLVLLLISIVLGGIWNTGGYLNRMISAKRRVRYHCAVSWFLFGLAIYHGSVLLSGPYTDQLWNIWIILGYLAAVTMLVVSLTGSFMKFTIKLIGAKNWRRVHLYSTFLSLAFVIFHGIAMGTDFTFIREREDIVFWAIMGTVLFAGVIVLTLYLNEREKGLTRIQHHSLDPRGSDDSDDDLYWQDDYREDDCREDDHRLDVYGTDDPWQDDYRQDKYGSDDYYNEAKKEVEIPCPKCGEQLSPPYKFCTTCGLRLAKENFKIGKRKKWRSGNRG